MFKAEITKSGNRGMLEREEPLGGGLEHPKGHSTIPKIENISFQLNNVGHVWVVEAEIPFLAEPGGEI